MPYKDPDARRAYQRMWIAERRALFFSDKHCRNCATKGILTIISLELDHINPQEKGFT